MTLSQTLVVLVIDSGKPAISECSGDARRVNHVCGIDQVNAEDCVDGRAATLGRRHSQDRHIGDFPNWKKHDSYQRALALLFPGLASGGEGLKFSTTWAAVSNRG